LTACKPEWSWRGTRCRPARPSTPTAEALRRIGEIYGIETTIRGRPPAERRRIREQQAKLLLADFEAWLKAMMVRLSMKSDTMAAILYPVHFTCLP
jgi:hypothetical protein